MESKYELLLHSVRLQILHALEDDRRMTLHELEERLFDVPPAMLARHVKILAENGLLVIAEEREEQGPAEPVYRVVKDKAKITPIEKRLASPADHMRYFSTFLAGLQGMFARYLKRPNVDIAADAITYRQETLYLTDEELRTMLADLEDRFQAERRKEHDPRRSPRVVSWVVLPESQPQGEF